MAGKRWKHGIASAMSLVIAVVVAVSACERTAARADDPGGDAAEAAEDSPRVAADSPIEAGRYLALVAGCNDCHTDGWMQTAGDIPEEDRLAGSPLGWRGPWGTTYAANLRLRVTEMTEDEWVAQLHTRDALPPMPWMNTKRLSDADARALYRYIRSLGGVGERMPAAVPPGEEPETPYVSMQPISPGS